MTARVERPHDASKLTYRRLVPRCRWPEAQDRLRKARVPYVADAIHEHRAVLVRTTGEGALCLDGLATVPPAGVRLATKAETKPAAPPEPSKTWRATDPLERAFRAAKNAPPYDPLERAFRKLTADVRAGRREGLP